MRRKLWFVWSLLLLFLIKKTHGACSRALGMQSGYIKDEQITASSELSDQSKASYARLYRSMGGLGTWCADRIENDKHPYLQIDLIIPHTITKIATQPGYSNRIEKYWLTFSYDTVSWHNYTVRGKVKVFMGNADNGPTPAFRNLSTPLTARALRIHPIVSTTNNLGACGRVELYGCQPTEDCKVPVGLEDRRISDQQITASSHWNEHYASNARLNNKKTANGSTTIWGGWCTDELNKNQFLQVDLGRVRSVKGVATQGYMYGMFVSQYKVNYSTDGQTWQSYRESSGAGKIFQGNWDNDTVIKKFFARRILARYIRFNPIVWYATGYICMRVEIYECLPTKGSVPSVSPPSETVELNRTDSVNLPCVVSGQPGLEMVWLKNGVNSLPPSDIYRSGYINGSVKSLLKLKHVKYKDRGAIFSCTAWYHSLSINSTRNVHLLVHAPRPVMAISEVKQRSVTLHVTDPTPGDTAKYKVRYKRTKPLHTGWLEEERINTNKDSVEVLVLNGLHPYMEYIVEVAPYYKDDDVGPYSVPYNFTTHEAAPSGPPRDIVIIPHGKNTMRVSWTAPSYEDCNGVITKHEIMYKQHGGTEQYLETKRFSKDITALKNVRQYQVAVRAYTVVGPGPYSDEQTYLTVQPNQGSEITAALEKLNTVTVTNTNAVKVMAEVRNITSKSSKLVEKDISITANILNKVVKTNSTSTDVGDQVLDTISHVMDAKGEILQKTQRKYNTSARFVKILEEYIDKGGRFSKGTPNVAVHTKIFSKTDKNIVTSIQTTKDQITFNTTANSTDGASEASLIVPTSVLPENNSRNSTLIVVYYRTSKLFKPDFRKIEVCEDSFTADKVDKVEPPVASSYTMENSSGDLITESSPVLAASLKNKQVVNLTTPIIIQFKMPHNQIVRNSTRCVWWDFKKGGWSTAGCALRGIVNDTIICECNHMTNFAALVDVEGHSSKACGKHSMALSLISYIGCALSIVGLALTIFTYGFFKKLRKDIAAKILLQLCTSLLCVNIVFVSGVERGDVSENACRIVAVLIHYFLLAAFLWMLIEAYFMYLAFVKVWRDHGDYVMWKCTALGWGLPILVVITTLAVDYKSYGGKYYCRLGDVAFFAAFMAPVLFVIVVNTVTFLLIMYKLSTRPANSADRDRGREGLLRIKRAFGILILVGLTWVFGFMAVSGARLVFQYLFVICNSLQGFSIFMFYCVIQKNVRECWWALVRCDLRSLHKSKSLFTDSYDRRRLSSASRAQNDAMRARTNTALSQILQLPMRDVPQDQNKVRDKNGVTDCQYHNNVADEDDRAQHVTILFEPADYQVRDLDGSQIIDVYESGDELSVGLSCGPGSRSPSVRSHGIPVTQSQHSSIRGSRNTVNSVQSTPKGLRLPRISGLRSAGTLNWSRGSMPVKETLKRTVSHTPEVPRPSSSCTCLRRTKSVSSLGNEKRFSGDASLYSDQTSCESLSSEAQTPTRKNPCLPVESLGVQIVSPFRGSVRGIVGYVESTVENFDLLIDLERKRSVSSPVRSLDGVQC